MSTESMPEKNLEKLKAAWQPVLYWSPSLAARAPAEPLAGLIDMTVANVPFCQVDGGWCPMSAAKLPDDMRRLVVEHPATPHRDNGALSHG